MTSKLLCGLATALLVGCGGGGGDSQSSPYVPPSSVVTKTTVTIMADHHMVVVGSNSATHDITGFFLDGTHMSLGTGQTVCAESDKNGWTTPNSTSKKCAPVVNGVAEIVGTPASDCTTWTLHSGSEFWWADVGLGTTKDNAMSIVGGTPVQVGTQKCVQYGVAVPPVVVIPPVILPTITKTIVTIATDRHTIVLGNNSATHDITGFFLDGTHMSLGTGQTVCAESDKNGWTTPNSTSKKCAPVVNGVAEIVGTPANDCVVWTFHSGTSFWWADIGLNENKDNAMSIVGGTPVQVGAQKCVQY